jgi:phospholipase C
MKMLSSLASAALCLATPASAQVSSFQHIMIVIQENRTPDNLFQGLCTPITANPYPCSTQPGPGQYNIQTTGWYDKTSPSKTTNPHVNPLGLDYDISHDHTAFAAMCDPNTDSPPACAMDGAARVPCTVVSPECPTKAAYGFVNPADVQPYIKLAQAYAWGNQMFETNQGPSFAAHQFLFGATSAPTKTDDHNGIFAAQADGPQYPTGCATPSAVKLIHPDGVVSGSAPACFGRQTLGDLLRLANKTWRYYGANGPSGKGSKALGNWIAPNSIKHICGTVVAGKCTGKEWTKNLEFGTGAILSDISTKCDLRDVSWVTPDALDSDHSGRVQGTGGPSWVASIVNAVGLSTCKDGNTPYWDDTAIIVTWDDWGGWYDHVVPPIEADPKQRGFQLGFRVPLIFVSAYTSPGLISNTREDFGSVIRFVERNFGITEGSLTFADAPSRGPGGDLSEYFNLSNPARTFQPISAPLSAKYFMTRPPSNLSVDDDD